MCDVPSIAVFCSESIECFPGTASKFFFMLFVIIPVAPFVTGIGATGIATRSLKKNYYFYYYYYYYKIWMSCYRPFFPGTSL
jgi:hypothetical protein